MHERAGRRVERLLAEREACSAADHDVQLFRAALLAVRLDQLITRLLGLPGVEPEGPEAEPAPQRPQQEPSSPTGPVVQTDIS